MYRAFGLLKPDCDFDLDEAIVRLTPRFPGCTIARSGDRITISKADWEVQISLVTGDYVSSETQGITDKLAGFEPSEAEALVGSNRRVEVWSDTPDPAMEHFNDYLAVVQVLRSFKGVVAVDPHEPSLL